MFKNIIAPVQAWLISQGRCAGCGTPLAGGYKKKLANDEEEVSCKKCDRVYIYNKQSKRYHRATLKIGT